ncbi:hypothetical protein BH683_010870 [Williamsia sp. 1138]|nr:hypothetical protein BH683_010870 [Williamsia sp. 1138]
MVERALAGISNIYIARDSRTSQLIGDKSRLFPDYAFRGQPLQSRAANVPSAVRSLLVVSLRHDRLSIEDAPTIDAIGRYALVHGLELKFVAQVREDSDQNARLAAWHGASFDAWDFGVSHSLIEERLAETYTRATAVVSDRLHVLILAARLGAIPIIFHRPSVTKLPDALDYVLLPQRIESGDVSAVFRTDSAEHKRIEDRIVVAAARMEELDAELVEKVAVSAGTKSSSDQPAHAAPCSVAAGRDAQIDVKEWSQNGK